MDNQSFSKESNFKDKMYTAFKYAITVISLFMVIVIFINAFMRYVFNYGFAASEELGRFAFIWLSFMGMTVAYYKGKHVGVDFLAERFKGGKRLAFDLITDAIVFVALFAMLYGSILYYQDTMLLKSPATNISYAYIYIAAIISALLMIFKLFDNIKKQIKTYTQYKSEGSEQ
ncbi:MAG: TRAP transporter small permease [Sedimentibacter sp.]